MINQPTTGEPIGGQSFVEGTEVFDVTGGKVGTVIAQDPQAGYLVVQNGWLFAHELYVPFAFVVSQDGTGLFLTLSRDELKDDRWKVPPLDAESAAAAHPPVVAGPEMGVVNTPAAAAAPAMESPVHEPVQPVTAAPMETAVKAYELPMSAPPLERGVRNDGWPVDEGGDSEDAQPVDMDMAPHASHAETDQSSQAATDLNVEEQPLQDEHPLDVVLAPDAAGVDAEQSSQTGVDPNVEGRSLQDKQPLDVDGVLDAADVDADRGSQTEDDLNTDEQPVHMAGTGADWSKQRDEREQRVLDRMEGAAAGVAATQTSLQAAATPEESRSGAALRAALLVGFDVALHQSAAPMLSEPSPRGSADPIAALLARVGPADVSEQAPLLAAAWRAALAVAADNPSVAPEVRRGLERLARD